jgi:2',3'-cyclic-nucleotide 2'-phosphodiesterase (5'-nucleotidase family)
MEVRTNKESAETLVTNISRRETLGLGLGAGLSVTMAGAEAAQTTPSNVAFTLLLVNDIYTMASDQGRGGYAKLAAVVKAERARRVPMLFCHAGDAFSPSLMSGFDQGAHVIELTNMVKPDVFVPGNHEFDFGQAVYFKRMKESNFPYFAANLRQADGSPIPGMKDAEIFTLGPVRVGVVGIAYAATPRVSQPGDLQFGPELDTLRAQADALRRQGADMIVAVTHTDRAMDWQIVRSRAVDVLLTGHDHDLAIEYDGRTVMLESNEDGYFVSAIDFAVSIEGEGKNRKVFWSPSFRIHNSLNVEPDPEVLAVVQRLEGGLSQELDIVIGTTEHPLDSRTVVVRSQEAAIGDLIADAIRAATGAQVGLINGGGIRGDTQYPAGAKLTRRDILSELPFGNTTVLVALPGADLKAALENGFSQLENRAGRFPQVSGLMIEVDERAPRGSRVVKVEVGGEPLDPDKTYRVATNNFLLAGGDGYTALAKGRILIGPTDGRRVSNEVMAYIRRLGTVDIRPEGRILIR